LENSVGERPLILIAFSRWRWLGHQFEPIHTIEPLMYLNGTHLINAGAPKGLDFPIPAFFNGATKTKDRRPELNGHRPSEARSADSRQTSNPDTQK
jgi:hypothetical protein